MSEWAIGNGETEERTAYEYRELYLDQDLEFKPFRCPFCDISLTPVNLYKAGEFARSPHFRASKEPHRYGCNGYPKIRKTREAKPAKRHIEKREFRLPEALVPRRAAVAHIKHGRTETQRNPDRNETNRRRREAASRLGPAAYRTSLVRSVAIAFLGVFNESYKLQNTNKWQEEQRREWVTSILKTSPLTLYDGYTLTYYSAIRNTRFPPPPKPRIFHGWALMTCTKHTRERTEYKIVPDTIIEQVVDETPRHYPVELTISITHKAEPTRSQRLMIEQLEKATTQALEARWFAYGAMLLCDDGIYRLDLAHIDHLYLHRLRKPIN